MNFEDSDNDGFADWSSGVIDFFSTVQFAAVFVDGVFEGKQSLMVNAPVGHGVEIRAMDANGEFTELLGIGTADSLARVTVQLSRPLLDGETVRPHDTTLDKAGAAKTVTEPEAVIRLVEPRGGTEDGGTTVTITGENLPTDPGTEVWFGTAQATVVSLSSEEIVIVTSALPQAELAFDVVPVLVVNSGSAPIEGDGFTYFDKGLLQWMNE